MAIVPDFVLRIVNAHLTVLLDWFSDRLYVEFLKHAADHLLVKLHTHLDCRPLELACAPFHHLSGPGAPPTHTVARLVRALLVKALFGWSLREWEWHLRFNLIVQWFVGYRLFDAGPDHATLERFEQWVNEHQHRVFFDEVLQQIDSDFPQERQQAQVGDTFALRADAAKESLIELIRHTCRRMLAVLAAADAERYPRLLAQLDAAALFGPADEVNELRLDAAGRQARLQTTVQAAWHCAGLVRAELDRPPLLAASDRTALQLRLAHLDKIWADELKITYDRHGQVARVAELPKDRKGAYRLGSATDPQATYRLHGAHKSDFGYNISLAVTDHFVREIRADTGAQPDPLAIPDLLSAQVDHHELCPSKFIYDAAAGMGKTYALVAGVSQGRTQLVSPLVDYAKNASRFTPSDFTLSEDGATLTCPNGQTTDIVYRAGCGQGRTFRFLSRHCADCPLWTGCRDPQADPQGIRHVFINDHQPYLQAAHTYNQTDDFKADMKRRALVERIIACLTRYNDARRARRRGTHHADWQSKLSAMAFNLKQWLKLLCHTQVVRG